jgi:acetyl-CoA carboxylase carboxyl transferase subunit beta
VPDRTLWRAFDTISEALLLCASVCGAKCGNREFAKARHMSWFKRDTHDIVPTPHHEVRTQGLWIKCDQCAKVLWKADLDANMQVCPNCGRHFKFDARQRIAALLEPGYELVDLELKSTDPLEFTDLKPYKERLAQARKKTGLNDAIINATGRLGEHDVVLSLMEYGFIGGSMGAVVGETIARAVDRSLATRHPLIIISASGGARMMEGIASLMQLAKVSTGLARMDDEEIPYISLMTDPTTGGVTASFAMLGDLNIAEPGALIGFAGPRVIEQTIRQKLPDGFQRSEFLLEHGFLDAVVPRPELKAYLDNALTWMQGSAKVEASDVAG